MTEEKLKNIANRYTDELRDHGWSVDLDHRLAEETRGLSNRDGFLLALLLRESCERRALDQQDWKTQHGPAFRAVTEALVGHLQREGLVEAVVRSIPSTSIERMHEVTEYAQLRAAIEVIGERACHDTATDRDSWLGAEGGHYLAKQDDRMVARHPHLADTKEAWDCALKRRWSDAGEGDRGQEEGS